MQNIFINVCLFITPAAVFAFPGAYWLGAAMLSLVGIVNLAQKRVSTTEVMDLSKELPMLWGFAIFAVVHVFLTIYHQEPAKDFGNIAPFILFPLMLAAFARSRADPTYFWLGCGVSGIVTLLIAITQVYFLDARRAYGHRNPITFGDTAIVLGTSALVGLFYCRSLFSGNAAKALLFVGGIAGLFSSLLSGSKGGWLSLVMVSLLISNAATRSMHIAKRLGIVVALFVSVATVAIWMPKLPVVDRLVSAYHGAKIWLQTGEITEGSASIRLEAFKAGLIVGARSPLLGLGRQGELDAVKNAVDAGQVHPDMLDVKVIDNDFISLFSKQGILGVLGVLAVHLGVFLTFWRHRHATQPSTKGLSHMGMLLAILYVEFGLSISIFGTNIFRTMYAAFAIILAGLLVLDRQGRGTSGGVPGTPSV